MSSSSNQPNNTLYVNNLNDKVHKDELRIQLLALFTTYGKVIDVVASKSPKMRGQAFLVFSDLAGATTAMRACEGMVFYDKPLRIGYAKTKSYATSRKDDPNFVPPNAANASELVRNGALDNDRKRQRDGDDEVARQKKREKAESDDEMEIDDDEEESAPQANGDLTPGVVPPQVHHPTSRLFCTNLPIEVTDSVLSILFQQYHGHVSTNVSMSPTPDVKMAQVIFQSAELASAAKEALDGYTLKKDWVMSVVYV
ncbi:RNA-binding domain-containing protein [Gymnopus androsaceus JB14]|uniref:RNA-binding domain-containing protein n=1 Tax=Gymnopus androsaceus JB14 TaxID=1447944 RepID=A0A6A4ILN0_9AGAR|nr:RNA-binding domain-containing protein [Gymnopus androsaceus JB14]